MSKKVLVTQVDNRGADYIFDVAVGSYKYTVTLAEDYYQQLTKGQVKPEALVENSFEFLLEREPASAILPTFDLPLIGRYFPEYEATIRKSLEEKNRGAL